MFKCIKQKTCFSNKELYLMSSILYMESKAGINITETFDELGSSFKNNSKKIILNTIKDNILNGKGLSDSLKESGNVFPNEFIALIEGGECSGNMEFAFKTLKQYYDDKIKVQNTINSALIYPILLFIVFNLCIIILFGFVIYRFQDLIISLNVKRDFKLDVIFKISSFVNENFLFSIIFFLLLYCGIFYLIKSLRLYRYISIINNLVNLKYDMFMIKLMSLLYDSGVSIRDILRNIVSSLDNSEYKNLIINVSTFVNNGYPLWKSFYINGHFSVQIVNIIQAGEKSGELSDSLKFIDEMLMEKLKISTEKIVALIQPIMIIIFAIVILLFFTTVLLPIFGSIGEFKV